MSDSVVKFLLESLAGFSMARTPEGGLMFSGTIDPRGVENFEAAASRLVADLIRGNKADLIEMAKQMG